MTDNEKRAHDLAIAYVGVVFANSTAEDPSFYENYVDMYNAFLARLSEDFPE